MLTVLLIACVIIIAVTGCGSEAERISNEGSVSGPAPPELTQDYVRQVAENRSISPMVVREVVITGEGDEHIVGIGIDRPSTLQNGSVIGVMGSYGQQVFSTLFEIPEVSYVTITMYGVEPGVPGDDVAMRLGLDRAKARETDYSMFGPMMLSDMVSEYYVDPAIAESTFSG